MKSHRRRKGHLDFKSEAEINSLEEKFKKIEEDLKKKNALELKIETLDDKEVINNPSSESTERRI